jgi:uncharacterized protein YndB with AHSA1/START domain
MAVLALAVGLIMNSPYKLQPGSDRRMLSISTDIAAAADSVYRFLGDTANAERWSVFIDEIAPLNADSVQPWAAGSRLRCFVRNDGKERRWDETVREAVPGRKRLLVLYGFEGFSAAPDSLTLEQIFAPMEDAEGREVAASRLTFNLYFTRGPGWRETLQMFFAAYSVKGIFSRDLAHVKRLLEKDS